MNFQFDLWETLVKIHRQRDANSANTAKVLELQDLQGLATHANSAKNVSIEDRISTVSKCTLIDKPLQGNSLSTISMISTTADSRRDVTTAFSRWVDGAVQVLTERQAQMLIAKYTDDRELWNRFWLYMGEQVNKGAPYEYVLESYETLELIWNEGIMQDVA